MWGGQMPWRRAGKHSLSTSHLPAAISLIQIDWHALMWANMQQADSTGQQIMMKTAGQPHHDEISQLCAYLHSLVLLGVTRALFTAGPRNGNAR